MILRANEETLGLNDLSLEQFRQELFEFFKQDEEFFKKMPNGVFTGFKFKINKKWDAIPDSIVAVLGYPQNLMRHQTTSMMKFIYCINPYLTEKKPLHWF